MFGHIICIYFYIVGCSLSFEDFANAQANTAVLDEAWRCRTCSRMAAAHPRRQVASPTPVYIQAPVQAQQQALNDEGFHVQLLNESGGRFHCGRPLLKEPEGLTACILRWGKCITLFDNQPFLKQCGSNGRRCKSCTRYNGNMLLIDGKLTSPNEALTGTSAKVYSGKLELLHCEKCNLYVDPNVSFEANCNLLNLIACPLQTCFTDNNHKCPHCNEILKSEKNQCHCCCWAGTLFCCPLLCLGQCDCDPSDNGSYNGSSRSSSSSADAECVVQ